eukprot:2133611-Amphidinium_carterae.1
MVCRQWATVFRQPLQQRKGESPIRSTTCGSRHLNTDTILGLKDNISEFPLNWKNTQVCLKSIKCNTWGGSWPTCRRCDARAGQS